VATFDLIEAFQTKNYHPNEEQIRRLMDIIVNDQVENMEIITGAYRVLQHILQTSGTTAFQKIWKIDHVDHEQGPLWNKYTDFWNFLEQLIPYQQSTDKVEKVERVERVIMLLDHIVCVFEADIYSKRGNLGNSILLSLIPKGYGRLRTNIKGHICTDSLKTELYIQMNKLDPFRFQLFLQTMASNTFKCILLDHALKDTNLTQISRQNRNSLNCPVNLLKITQIYFDSSPYYKNSTKSSATWRHIFILCSLLQSYIQSKIFRVGDKIYSGLDDDEINLIGNSNEINERINELVDSLNEDEDIDLDLKKRTKFLLDLNLSGDNNVSPNILIMPN
ncbi:79_t:CDS:2, partial [Diversispora eburnea]